jgi:antitoxin component YwqK of YwqJK toxin-antitoxin module
MKKLLYAMLLSIFIVLAGCASKEISVKNVEKRDGIIYEKGKEKPFSGTITNYLDDALILEIEVKKGKYHGEFNLYNKEGKLLVRKTYKDGELIKEEKFASDIEILKNMFNNILDSFKL